MSRPFTGRPLTRRQLIGGSARLGFALAWGVPLLQACGSDSNSKKNTKTIADGLEPESGTLRIFNYDSYVNPDVVAAFEAEYGVKTEITTFTTDDEAITKLAAKGGVMGITGVRNFVRDREPTTIEHIVDHIDHVARVAGIDHVGLGSDFDGVSGLLPVGMNDVTRLPYLVDPLFQRGYSDQDVTQILGGNMLRVMEDLLG